MVSEGASELVEIEAVDAVVCTGEVGKPFGHGGHGCELAAQSMR